MTCNCCGKTEAMDVAGIYGFHVIRLQGGYGDHFPGDMENLEIVVCEDCLKKWVDTFEHPEVCDGANCIMPGPDPVFPCKHSEDLAEMSVDWPYLYPKGITKPEIEAPAEDEIGEVECPGGNTVWIHFKGNRRYLVIYGIVYHALTGEPHVLYQGLYGDHPRWVRPLSMWADQVNKDLYKGPRFKLLGIVER